MDQISNERLLELRELVQSDLCYDEFLDYYELEQLIDELIRNRGIK